MCIVKSINKSSEAEEGRISASIWMKELNLCNLLFHRPLCVMETGHAPHATLTNPELHPVYTKNRLFLHLQRRIGATHSLQVLFHLALLMVLFWTDLWLVSIYKTLDEEKNN